MPEKKLIKPPRLRTNVAKERDRHATWLELFYDLVYVVALSQLADNLDRSYSFVGLSKFIIVFVPVWWAWVGHTFYLTRFDSDDLLHRLFTMAQILAVSSLIIFLPDALSKNSTGFALSYAAVRFLLVAEYYRARRYIPQVRPIVDRYMLGFGSAAALWVLSVLVPVPYHIIVWYVAIVIDFSTPITAGRLHVKFPPHLMHLPERFGLFTIIVIGEALLSIVLEIKADSLTFTTVSAGVMGLIIAFCLWWGYFEGAEGASAIQLTSKNHVRAYQQWLYSHLPLTMGITSMAIGIKQIIAQAPGSTLPIQEALILSASTGVCLLSLNTIFLSSYPGRPPDKAIRLVLPLYGLAILTIAGGFLSYAVNGIIILAFLTLLNVLQILYSLKYFPWMKEPVK